MITAAHFLSVHNAQYTMQERTIPHADLTSLMHLLAQASVGGTSIQQWLPVPVLGRFPSHARWAKRSPPKMNFMNAMVAPLRGITLSSVVFYQVGVVVLFFKAISRT